MPAQHSGGAYWRGAASSSRFFRGVDRGALLRELHVPPAALADPESRLRVALDRRLWALAATRTGDPTFGLHVAASFGIGTFEALDYAMWASETLAGAIDRFVRFHRLIGDDAALRVERRARRVHLVRESTDDLPQRAECFFAALFLRARDLVDGRLVAHEVRFLHRALTEGTAHRTLFGCPVRFGARTSALVLDAGALRLPVRSARPGLARVLDRYMHALQERLPAPDAFLARVLDTIARALGGGRPSLEATSVALRASPRTVQRRLRALGVTHRQLVERVRQDLARRMLDSARLSITEITFLLGFEDVSGFYRAHRRWTGVAPSRGRARRHA